MRWSIFLSLLACGGAKPADEPLQIGPPPPPAPARCPDVIYSCTDPAVGCFEGGADYKTAVGATCRKTGGLEGIGCDPAGMLGSCTTTTGAFAGCSTLWIKRGIEIQTPDDGKAACTKVHGTWVTATR